MDSSEKPDFLHASDIAHMFLFTWYTLYLGWLLPVGRAYFCTDQ